MKMHEHDQELIMALAEGTLDDASAETAAAEISACAECSADLELQRFAIEALDAAPDVYLTATESAQLHSNLKHRLGVAAPAPARARRSFSFARWAPIAGLAAVFVLLVAIGPGLITAGDDDASDEVVAGVETTAAADFAQEAPMEEMASVGRAEDDLSADGGTDVAATEAPAETTASPETTEAAAETTTAAPTSDAFAFLGFVEELDTEQLLELIISGDAETLTLSENAKADDPEFLDCLIETASGEAAGEWSIVPESEPFILGLTLAETGEEFILVAYVPNDATQTVFLLHDPATCQVVAALP